jgi:hypothetical protein
MFYLAQPVLMVKSVVENYNNHRFCFFKNATNQFDLSLPNLIMIGLEILTQVITLEAISATGIFDLLFKSADIERDTRI